MVAVIKKYMDLLELISFVRSMKKEGYDRYCFEPIPKSDKVMIRTWKSKSARRKKKVDDD